MSIPLLVYYVLAKMMSAIDTAPSRNGISEPLISSVESSDGYKLSNEMILFRRQLHSEVINTGKYEGYIYNKNKCIQFNNRILCGYDRNNGHRLDDYTMLDIGHGCRTRGDRIECGYDNPVKVFANLRFPNLKDNKQEGHANHGKHNKQREHSKHGHHVKHGEYSNQSEHDEPQGDNRHHHNGNKHRTRQVPTRTGMTTDPTIQPIILNRFQSDNLDNKLLESAVEKHLLKVESSSEGNKKTTTDTRIIEQINSTTDMVNPLTTTATKPNKGKPTPEKISSKSPTLSKALKTTPTNEVSTIRAANSESNDIISDDETVKQIVKLEPLIPQKRRRLIDMYAVSSKLRTDPKSDTTATQIRSPCDTTNNKAGLVKGAKRTEEKLKTTCVEQGERVVCYDFTT